MKREMAIQYYQSVCGEMVLVDSGGKLSLCDWSKNRRLGFNLRRLTESHSVDFREKSTPILHIAIMQLEEYFAGYRRQFDITLLPLGTTFQQRVWDELTDIPYGETRSYKEIAEKMGKAEAVRAVAQAIGANGISIFIPCHRVVGSNGRLTGYAGGLEAKKRLIGIEKE